MAYWTRRKGRLKAAAAVSLAAMILTACGAADDDAADPADDDDAVEEADDEEADDDDGDAGDAAPGDDRIVYVHIISGESFDPDRSPGGTHIGLLQPSYDRLVHVDVTTTELQPGLAESWEFLEDNTILEMNLREGVVFHDGEPFNAEAVAANVERSQTLEDGFDEVREASAPIDRVEVVDEYTVRFHRADDAELGWALLEARLAENLGMMISPATIEADLEQAEVPSGAGPWKVVSFTRERIVFERFDDYWDEDVHIVSNLEILDNREDSARTSGIITGEFNIVRVPDEDVERVEREENVEVTFIDSTEVLNVYTNHARPNMQSRELRRAFLYGIDRQGIVDALYQGNGSPTLQTFPPGYFAAAPGVDLDAYPFDPERARELVIEAGFEDGVELDVLVLEVYTDQWSVIQEQMAQIGVTLNLDVVETSRWPEYLEGDYDIYMGRRSRLAPLDILDVSLNETGFFNPGGLIPEIQPLLEEAAALPGEERVETLQEISRLATEEGYLHTLFAFQIPWGTNCVEGFQFPIYTTVDFKGARVIPDCG